MKMFRITKPLAAFLVLALCLCLSFSFTETESKFTLLESANAEIDTEAIQNSTGEAVEDGIPFLLTMIFIGGGMSAILGGLYVNQRRS